MRMKPAAIFHASRTRVLAGLFSGLFAISAAIAATSPESIDNTTKVDAEAFIELVDEIDDLIIIDSRIPGDRKQGYIEGSLSLPDVDTTCESLAKVIPKMDSPSLFYCNGVKCGRSAEAIKIALSCGYNNIYWFRGGFEEWLHKGYPYLQQ
ncbi:MAG: rhodanese-like domain-containing protein [Gammaproteobacteria bacterium]|nr:rhodanese-like domain-containing protein [Gammaproteobacteria bacterium]